MTLKSGGAADPHVLLDPQCMSKVEGGSAPPCTGQKHISFKIIVLPNLETSCMP